MLQSVFIVIIVEFFICGCTGQNKYCPSLKIPHNVIWNGPCRKARTGEKCIFSCNENFILEGQDELFCTATMEWNGVVPQCKSKIKYCPELNIPNNVISEGSCRKAKPGEECRFKCKENVILDGKKRIFCVSALEWSAAVPRCQEKKHCPALEIPDNAIWEGPCRNATVGEKCTFKCKKKFSLKGKNELICSATTEWNGVVPQCKKKRCPALEIPDNVIWEGPCKNATIGEKCTFKCKEKFSLEGKNELICSATTEWNGVVPHCNGANGFDCADIKQKYRESRDGVYKIRLLKLNNKTVDVLCDMTTDGGGWTVFQRRGTYKNMKPKMFYRNWQDYETGFGNLTEEFWLGLKYIHAITENEQQVLRVDMQDFEENKKFAKYLDFTISDRSDDYKLTARLYRGTAGDSLVLHNGCRFTTKDHGVNSLQTAAEKFKGAWWYLNTHTTYSNLNGLNLRGKHKTFADGIMWYTFHSHYYSLKKTEMKMRPRVYFLDR